MQSESRTTAARSPRPLSTAGRVLVVFGVWAVLSILLVGVAACRTLTRLADAAKPLLGATFQPVRFCSFSVELQLGAQRQDDIKCLVGKRVPGATESQRVGCGRKGRCACWMHC